MHQKQFLSVIMVSLFFLASCGGEHVADAGSHFQNRDCLECHNRDLTPSAALTYGGTLYLDRGSDPDDLSKMCKEQVYIQLESSIDSSILHDGRTVVSSDDSGALGRGNLYLEKSVASIPVGSHYMRLVLADGTLLARSGLHQFFGSFDASNTSDTNNRYSCNGCHSISPTGGATGLMVVDQNLSACLTNNTDVPVTTFFEADTFPVLENKCGSCHNVGQAGSIISNFDLDSSNITLTRTDLIFWLINKTTPSASALFTCVNDSNHTNLEICNKAGSDYNRLIEWITLEP